MAISNRFFSEFIGDPCVLGKSEAISDLFFSSFVEFSVLTFELAIDFVLFFIEMFSFEFFEFYHHQSRSRSC